MSLDQIPERQQTDEKRSSLPLRPFVILITTVLVLEIVINGYISGRWNWDGTGFSGASLWDWLDLLIVPLMLGIGGIWFQSAQRQRELASQEAQRQRELASQE